jgi:iron complex transport system permease protein
VLVVLVLAVCAAVAVALGLLVGGPLEGLSAEVRGQIVMLRGSRALAAVVAGAALGLGGVVLQSLLRNPLASPDVLGPSAGAALAVVVAVGVAALAGGGGSGGGGEVGSVGLVWQTGPALVGAWAALGLVFVLGRRNGVIDPGAMVLIGVVLSVLCAAGVIVADHVFQGLGVGGGRGTMSGQLIGAIRDEAVAAGGGTGGGGGLRWWLGTPLMGVVVAGCVVWAVARGRRMDAASLSDDEAAGVGLNLARQRVELFVMGGVLTSVAVVIAGPVGFVGLVAPHVTRRLMSAAGAGGGCGGGGRWGVHGVLVVGSACAGAGLLAGADAVARAVDLGAGRLPVGAVPALVGGPVLVWLIARRGRAARGSGKAKAWHSRRGW